MSKVKFDPEEHGWIVYVFMLLGGLSFFGGMFMAVDGISKRQAAIAANKTHDLEDSAEERGVGLGIALVGLLLAFASGAGADIYESSGRKLKQARESLDRNSLEIQRLKMKPAPLVGLQEIAQNITALFADLKQLRASIKNQEADEHKRELKLMDLDESFETTVKSLFTTQENDHDSAPASNPPVPASQS
jgi:hypothetical protein